MLTQKDVNVFLLLFFRTDDHIRATIGHTMREVVAIYERPDNAFAQSAMDKLEGANRA